MILAQASTTDLSNHLVTYKQLQQLTLVQVQDKTECNKWISKIKIKVLLVQFINHHIHLLINLNTDNLIHPKGAPTGHHIEVTIGRFMSMSHQYLHQHNFSPSTDNNQCNTLRITVNNSQEVVILDKNLNGWTQIIKAKMKTWVLPSPK